MVPLLLTSIHLVLGGNYSNADAQLILGQTPLVNRAVKLTAGAANVIVEQVQVVGENNVSNPKVNRLLPSAFSKKKTTNPSDRIENRQQTSVSLASGL